MQRIRIPGVLNLLILLDILKIWQKAKVGTHNHAHLEQLLQQRGFINRLFGRRLFKFLDHSWHIYPLGLLFGLGFDAASEVGVLAMTAGASAGDVPIGAVLSLPALFAAGMTVMDTTDGILMSNAYNWAFINPLRKIFCNLTTTGLSVAVALVIGTVESLQVIAGALHLHGRGCWFDGHLITFVDHFCGPVVDHLPRDPPAQRSANLLGRFSHRSSIVRMNVTYRHSAIGMRAHKLLIL